MVYILSRSHCKLSAKLDRSLLAVRNAHASKHARAGLEFQKFFRQLCTILSPPSMQADRVLNRKLVSMIMP